MKTDTFFDKATRDELSALNPVLNTKEIENCFYRDFELDTSDLRGIMDAGTNHMVMYTIRKVMKGLVASSFHSKRKK